MLVDIEMPRMDGFDLTRNVRADARLKHVPIIMITSRTADKHQNYAREIGVNSFLGKPYQEDQLLGEIGGFLKDRRVAA
jgi:chemosensory pili system protein ChpA (sensor histidine kinase/response regulator)